MVHFEDYHRTIVGYHGTRLSVALDIVYQDLDPPGEPKRYAVDTARGVYVPTDQRKRVWTGSWIYEQSHIQICVRNTACILGTWLHKPATTGAADGQVSN